MDFFDFYKEICKALGPNGGLEDLTVLNCIIYNVPKYYPVFGYKTKLLFMKEITQFCGFGGRNLNICGNKFSSEQYAKTKEN